MKRMFLPVMIVAALLGACGDDDGDEAADATTTTEAAEDGEAPPLGPAEITAEDQSGDGTTVDVTSVTLPATGYVVIHADADGSPGPVIGHSDVLEAGETTDVTVTLDEPLAADATVWPMAHVDVDQNDEYDFMPPDVTTDAPATFADGGVAVISIAYTVEDGGGDAAGGSSVTIADFSFDPETTEVASGTTITWTNEDGVAHTVTAGSPGSQGDAFDEGVDSGESVEITFDEAGTFAYFCSIHPSMTAEVVVT